MVGVAERLLRTTLDDDDEGTCCDSPGEGEAWLFIGSR
jgi:hypothetical protein